MFHRFHTLSITGCTFQNNIGYAGGAIRINPEDLSVEYANTGLTHITIQNCKFYNNGAIASGAAIYITFPRDLYNILLDTNEFKDNAT
jgi:hypothetical protein